MKNLTILLIIASLFSCTKDEPKQYSEWIIGNDTLRSNEFKLTSNGRSPLTHLICNQNDKRVFIEFFHPNFPTSGSYLLVRDNTYQQYNKCVISFYHSPKSYYISNHEAKYATASSVNGKFRITLPETWYVNRKDPNDSVLIQGVFNEP